MRKWGGWGEGFGEKDLGGEGENVSDAPLYLTQILTLNRHSEPSIIFPKNLPDIPAISALLNYYVAQP